LHQLERKGRVILDGIFGAFAESYLSDGGFGLRLLPESSDRVIRSKSDRRIRARLICDYVAGMTDGFALRTSLIPRTKSQRWKIMLPVIGMTGFAVAIALLGLHLTPDSNGSYTSLGLSDRTVRLVANKVKEAPADAARQASVDMAKEWAKECIAAGLDMEAVEQIGQKYIDVLSERLRNEHGVTNQEDINDYIGIMSLHTLHHLGELL
jgi:hypothetical protein